MNKRAMLAATAILVGSFNPVLATQAWAAVVNISPNPPTAEAADSDTVDAMQLQCDTLAAAHDIGNGDEWTGEVVVGAVTLSAVQLKSAPTRSTMPFRGRCMVRAPSRQEPYRS